jgi:hypothetical protein
MNNIEIINKMVTDNNPKAMLASFSNVLQCSTGMEYGKITLAISNDVALNYLNDNRYYVGGLFLIERSEFEKYQEIYKDK